MSRALHLSSLEAHIRGLKDYAAAHTANNADNSYASLSSSTDLQKWLFPLDCGRSELPNLKQSGNILRTPGQRSGHPGPSL